MESDPSDHVEDSADGSNQASNVEERLPSANRELVEEYDEDRLKSILKLWYNVDFNARLKFPEVFDTVPAHHLADRIWRLPMTYEEVGHRLLGKR